MFQCIQATVRVNLVTQAGIKYKIIIDIYISLQICTNDANKHLCQCAASNGLHGSH
jgi:hypothetical protein